MCSLVVYFFLSGTNQTPFLLSLVTHVRTFISLRSLCTVHTRYNMVNQFFASVRWTQIEPSFQHALNEHWPVHIEKICNKHVVCKCEKTCHVHNSLCVCIKNGKFWFMVNGTQTICRWHSAQSHPHICAFGMQTICEQFDSQVLCGSLHIPHVSQHWIFLPLFYGFFLHLSSPKVYTQLFSQNQLYLEIYLMYRRLQVLVGKIMNYRIRALHRNFDRWCYKSIKRKWAPVLGQPMTNVIIFLFCIMVQNFRKKLVHTITFL